jgi:hypothetical protein
MTDTHDQFSLFHEDIYEALRTCVQALGGAKRVGHELWPDMPPDKAGNRLNDALSRNKRDVLNPEQLLLILRKAREAGCHAGMYFIAEQCDYSRPSPVEPLDELADLQKQYIQAVKAQQAMLERMERLQSLREKHYG